MEKQKESCNGTFEIKKSEGSKTLDIVFHGTPCAISFEANLIETETPVKALN